VSCQAPHAWQQLPTYFFGAFLFGGTFEATRACMLGQLNLLEPADGTFVNLCSAPFWLSAVGMMARS
jgi:hypothetical protein